MRGVDLRPRFGFLPLGFTEFRKSVLIDMLVLTDAVPLMAAASESAFGSVPVVFLAPYQLRGAVQEVLAFFG